MTQVLDFAKVYSEKYGIETEKIVDTYYTTLIRYEYGEFSLFSANGILEIAQVLDENIEYVSEWAKCEIQSFCDRLEKDYFYDIKDFYQDMWALTPLNGFSDLVALILLNVGDGLGQKPTHNG